MTGFAIPPGKSGCGVSACAIRDPIESRVWMETLQALREADLHGSWALKNKTLLPVCGSGIPLPKSKMPQL